VPIVQKHISANATWRGKPVITATQMLDSMIRNPRANACGSGRRGKCDFRRERMRVELSGETQRGNIPMKPWKP
jgi:pyruvate kinase